MADANGSGNGGNNGNANRKKTRRGKRGGAKNRQQNRSQNNNKNNKGQAKGNNNNRRNKGKSNNGGGGGGGQGGSPYTPHLDAEALQKGIAEGVILQGKLRISASNRHEAYVTVEGFTKDIFINGVESRNRALPGDTVAVTLLDKSEWQKVKYVDATNVYDQAPVSQDEADRSRSLWQPLNLKAATVDASSSAPSAAAGTGADQEGCDDGEVLQPAGLVVAIINQTQRPDLVGALPIPKNTQKGKPLPTKFSFVLFNPRDRRYPYIIIPRRHLPEKYVADPHAEAGKELFLAVINEWEASSRFPKGILKSSLGEAGEIPVETAALLQTHDVDHGDFPADVLAEVEQYDDDWTPPPEELAKREDLRALRIFSIDPTGAKDLDDALSIEWDAKKNL